MVFVVLQSTKVAYVGGAVHLRTAVGIDGPALVRHNGVSQAVTHPAGFPPLPSLISNLGYLLREKIDVFRRLHHVRRNLVPTFAHHRRGMRMRGIQDKLVDVKIGQLTLESCPHTIENTLADRDQVARDKNCLIADHIAFARFQRHGGRGYRALNASSHTSVHLPRQSNWLLWRDARRGGTHQKLSDDNAGVPKHATPIRIAHSFFQRRLVCIASLFH